MLFCFKAFSAPYLYTVKKNVKKKKKEKNCKIKEKKLFEKNISFHFLSVNPLIHAFILHLFQETARPYYLLPNFV